MSLLIPEILQETNHSEAAKSTLATSVISGKAGEAGKQREGQHVTFKEPLCLKFKNETLPFSSESEDDDEDWEEVDEDDSDEEDRELQRQFRLLNTFAPSSSGYSSKFSPANQFQPWRPPVGLAQDRTRDPGHYQLSSVNFRTTKDSNRYISKQSPVIRRSNFNAAQEPLPAPVVSVKDFHSGQKFAQPFKVGTLGQPTGDQADKKKKASFPEEDEVFEMDKLPFAVKLKIGQCPLQPATGYKLFMRDNYANLRKSHGAMSHQELHGILYQRWINEISAPEREDYLKKASADKLRYRRELLNYNIHKNTVLKEYFESQAQPKQIPTAKPLMVAEAKPKEEPQKQVTAIAEKDAQTAVLSGPVEFTEGEQIIVTPIRDPDAEEKTKSENTAQKAKLKFKSAFKLFKLDHILKVKEEMPNASFKERVQFIKGLWKALSPNEKYLYVKRSRLDKKR